MGLPSELEMDDAQEEAHLRAALGCQAQRQLLPRRDSAMILKEVRGALRRGPSFHCIEIAQDAQTILKLGVVRNQRSGRGGSESPPGDDADKLPQITTGMKLICARWREAAPSRR